MAKRFNDLDRALKYLRPPGAADGAESPDAPVGSQLRQYQDFKSGKRVVTYTRAAASLPGNIKAVGLKPFAVPAASTTRYLVPISNRSLTNFPAAGVTAELLNIDTTPEGTAALQKVFGFTSAKATVKNVTGTAATTATSKITGDTYKRKNAASYTFPFGASTDQPSYSQAKAVIIAAVTTATGNKGVSFSPEIFR